MPLWMLWGKIYKLINFLLGIPKSINRWKKAKEPYSSHGIVFLKRKKKPIVDLYDKLFILGYLDRKIHSWFSWEELSTFHFELIHLTVINKWIKFISQCNRYLLGYFINEILLIATCKYFILSTPIPSTEIENDSWIDLNENLLS